MAEAEKGFFSTIRFPLVLGVVCAVAGGMLGLVYSVTADKIAESRKRKVSAAFFALVPGFGSFTEKPGERPGEVLYVIKDASGAVAAYAAKTLAEGSYNSMQPIELVTVMNKDLSEVLGMRVVNSAETPGLGERIKDRPAANSLAGRVSGAPSRQVVLLQSGRKEVHRVVGKTAAGVRVLSEEGGETVLEGATVLEEELPPSFQAQFSRLSPDDLAFTRNGGRIDAISGATVSSTAVLGGVKRGVEALRSAFGAPSH